MLGRTVNEVLYLNNFSWVWGNTIKFFHNSDLRLINLECVISSKGKPDPRSYFHFRANPKAIKVLKKAKIDFVSIANNHVMDFGEEALIEMLELLRKNKIAYAGAGKNIEEASRPAFLEKSNFKISIISAADHPKWWEADKNKPGINFISIDSIKHLERIKKSIEIAKRVADIIIFSCHIGPHFRTRPSKEFINFARKILDLGADVYWGHSNHIPQGVEIYNEKIIIYDSGDFVDDYAVDKFEYFSNDQSFIFILKINKNKKIDSLELIPVKIDSFKMQVNLAEGEDFDLICSSMIRLCEDFGTIAKIHKNKLVVKIF